MTDAPIVYIPGLLESAADDSRPTENPFLPDAHSASDRLLYLRSLRAWGGTPRYPDDSLPELERMQLFEHDRLSNQQWKE